MGDNLCKTCNRTLQEDGKCAVFFECLRDGRYWIPRPLPKCEVTVNPEIVTNERGGKQSKLDAKWTDFDPKTLQRMARRSALGFKKYGAGNWRKIPASEHIDHALEHVMEHLTGNREEDHLAGAVCRLLFTMSVEGSEAE